MRCNVINDIPKYRSCTRRTRITNEDEDFLFRNITRRIYTTSEHKRERLWHFCIKKPSYQDVVKLKIVWFFRQIIYKNCSIRSRISTNQVFFKCGFKNLCFQLPREPMNDARDKCQYRLKWGKFGPPYLLNIHITLYFSKQTLVGNI